MPKEVLVAKPSLMNRVPFLVMLPLTLGVLVFSFMILIAKGVIVVPGHDPGNFVAEVYSLCVELFLFGVFVPLFIRYQARSREIALAGNYTRDFYIEVAGYTREITNIHKSITWSPYSTIYADWFKFWMQSVPYENQIVILESRIVSAIGETNGLYSILNRRIRESSPDMTAVVRHLFEEHMDTLEELAKLYEETNSLLELSKKQNRLRPIEETGVNGAMKSNVEQIDSLIAANNLVAEIKRLYTKPIVRNDVLLHFKNPQKYMYVSPLNLLVNRLPNALFFVFDGNKTVNWNKRKSVQTL